METPDVEKAVAQVIDRLAAKHPDIARERIESIVDDVQAQFAEVPVTDFIPVLVEHDANQVIREIDPDADTSES